jgi:TetR/AcrR family transcriptional regulator, transcriptional repressor for nem operon
VSEQKTREHIIDVADQCFYRQGYERTSFADIADAVKISRGNFYHHFKTKDEILESVIVRRLANTRKMLEQWENEGKSPTDRIKSFVHILIANQAKIRLYGCPVGTLCSELAKMNHTSQAEANKIFTLFRAWLREQFVLLGRKTDADDLAMHLLARSQGIATLYNAFHDEKFLKKEVRQMCSWLESHEDSGVSNVHPGPEHRQRVSQRRPSH